MEISKKSKFWFDDYRSLYENKSFLSFVPSKNMDKNDNLNAIARFGIYLFIILIAFGEHNEWLYLPLFLILTTIILHKIDSFDNGKMIKPNIEENAEDDYAETFNLDENKINNLKEGFFDSLDKLWKKPKSAKMETASSDDFLDELDETILSETSQININDSVPKEDKVDDGIDFIQELDEVIPKGKEQPNIPSIEPKIKTPIHEDTEDDIDKFMKELDDTQADDATQLTNKKIIKQEKENIQRKKDIQTNFNDFKEKIQKEYVINPKESDYCVQPSNNNPFMNPLIAEIDEFPNRPPACNNQNEEVKKDMEKKFLDGLYMDVEEAFNTNNSFRQFYSVPGDMIQNDQTKFAKWCYDSPATCKTTQERCLRYEDVRFKRQ